MSPTINSHREQKVGVVDWKLKQAALHTMFGTSYAKELAARVVGERTDESDAYANSMTTWTISKPKGNIRFFTLLLQRLEISSQITPQTLVECSYDQFVSLLPENRKQSLPHNRPSTLMGTIVDYSEAVYHPMWMPKSITFETAREAINRGRVDQKLLYLNPDAAERWQRVINAFKYPTYEECKSSLRDLTQRQVWKDFAASSKTDGIIMLGAGSPSKDLVLINSMINEKNSESTVHHTSVDISFYMLLSSLRIVDGNLRGDSKRQHVRLITLIWDFMNLQGSDDHIRRETKNVAWVLPGGTIGNLDEGAFVDSLISRTIKDDLLIVSAEIIDEDDSESQKENIIAKYNNKEVVDFVTIPLRSIWHDLDLPHNVEDAVKKLKFELVEGDKNKYSNVPKSKTVEVSIELPDKNHLVLATSTRYYESEFIKFVEKGGFEHLEGVSSKLNPNFKQFMFRRIE